jgi:flagellar M-ring protein FliF
MDAATPLTALNAGDIIDAKPINPTLEQRWTRMDKSAKTRLIAGVVVLIAVGIVALVMGRQPDWRVLYANLPEKDGGAIIAQLTTMNVPYKYTEGGGAILVPADKVHDSRLKLASLGLPKGSVAGFEQMDASRFGMTQFQERLSFQRGLEGELTRSIQALSSVQTARVHLALPNQNGFFREQQKPSASVLVSLHPGRTLDRTQLAGIVHLVASSVPELNPAAVSVLDDSGKLLSTPADGMGAANGADAQQLAYVQHIEALYTRRILDILEPVVGRNNVKAQVTAEVDFSQTEQTSEQHRPNQTQEAGVIRSQQVVETNTGTPSQPSGVPGAATNQPPAPTTAPINSPAQTLQASGGAQGSTNTRKESITNYEVDKTIKVVKAGTGVVKRLSAAVVLNNLTTTDEKGKTTTVPLNEQQIQKMTALVRETIGYSQDRGDSVNLMNAPFTKELVVEPDVPIWKDPQVQDLARSAAWPLTALLAGILVLFGMIRPAIRALNPPPTPAEQARIDALLAEANERPMLEVPEEPKEPEITPAMLALEEARTLTRDNPAAVANILKSWVNGEPLS